jgi:hypothetical protein
LVGYVYFGSIELSPPWTSSTIFLLPINNIFCFPWFSILEHLFFSCFTSYCNINIHHIHIWSDYMCLNNKLNLYYYHKFSMKCFLHFSKLWTIYHFMFIQTTGMACIWRCLLWFLIWLCYLCGSHYGLFFLLFACLHIVIHHPIVYAIFISLTYITLCLYSCCLFGTLWYWKCIPYLCNNHAFSTQHHRLLMML